MDVFKAVNYPPHCRICELEAALDWALQWHISQTDLKAGRLGWGHAPTEAICDTLNERRAKHE